MLKALAYLVIAFPLATAVNFFPAGSRAEVLNKDGYDFVTSATDGTIYLGKIRKVINDMKIIDFIAIDDPKKGEGSEYTYHEVFRCSDRTYKDTSEGKWKKSRPGSTGEIMITWACVD